MDGLIAELENIAEILFNNGYNSWGMGRSINDKSELEENWHERIEH